MTAPAAPTYTCYDDTVAAVEDSVASNTLLDVIEDPGVLNTTPGSLSTAKAFVAGGGGGLDFTNANFPYLLGGGVSPTFVTQGGFGARRFAPGTNQASSVYSIFGMPLKRDLSIIPASIRRQHRFVWDTVIARTTPLIAGVKLSIGLADDGLEFSTVGGGVALTSQSTLNAGRWTLQFYLVNGGALQTGADSGVVPTGLPQHFRFEYFDIYPAPYLNIYIDGVLRYTLTGATLPPFDGNEPLNYLVVAGGAVNTIGQLDHQYYSRFLVELLP